MERNTPLTEVKGIGEKTAALLHGQGLYTAGDLYTYYPRAYDRYEAVRPLSAWAAGECVSVLLTVTGTGQTIRAGRRTITHLQAASAESAAMRGTVSAEAEHNSAGAAVFAEAGSAGAETAVSTEAGNENTAAASVDAGAGRVALAGTLSAEMLPQSPQRVRLTYFNMPYLRKTLPAGTTRVFRGILKRLGNGGLYMEQPQVFTVQEYESLAGRLRPRYSLPAGFRKKTFLRLAEQIVRSCPPPPEYMTGAQQEWLRELSLPPEEEAARTVHFPPSQEAMERARGRLIFDEFYLFLAAVHLEKEAGEAQPNLRPMEKKPQPQALIDALPYELTAAQRAAWAQIEGDLTGPHVMNRLLEGDVGSGKTILAALALLLCAANGRQGAMMAPTEVLAAQHFQTITQLAQEYGLPIRPVLLTGSVKGRARRSVYEAIATGAANVVIGTHALIQDAVEYRDLGLVITDEQHRFGVRQRARLSEKGDAVPVLVMSATPIPRTLAVILYGDLQISVLRELPKNRLPIKNCVIAESARARAYRFVLREVEQGRQAYVICPAIEPPSENAGGFGADEDDGEDVWQPGVVGFFDRAGAAAGKSGIAERAAGRPDMAESAAGAHGAVAGTAAAVMANVTETAEYLRRELPPQVRLAVLHGRMKPQEKEAVMERFAAGEINVLVSTTVVEVGINVPNATVMVVENAERFGLAQLHQLRGRIGRGSHQSYCVFLYGGQGEKPKRLSILEQSNDGFFIAERDLALRGPGDLFGVRQSGEMGFALADIYEDAGLLQKAAALLGEATAKDSSLSGEAYAPLRARLQEQLRQQWEKSSVDFRTI